MSDREFYHKINEASKTIQYRHDGPVTDFVAISRAIELARQGLFSADDGTDPLAEALWLALKETEKVEEPALMTADGDDA